MYQTIYIIVLVTKLSNNTMNNAMVQFFFHNWTMHRT